MTEGIVSVHEGLSGSRRRKIVVHTEDTLSRNGIVAMLAKNADFEVLSGHRAADADIAVVVRSGADVVDALRSIAGQARPRFVAVARDHRAIDLLTAAELGLAAVVPLRDISAVVLRSAVLTA